MVANFIPLVLIALWMVAGCLRNDAAEPPFWGTIFINPDIVTPTDPTSFLQVTDRGRGIRTMFDRRVNDWVSLNAFLFQADFNNGSVVEVQVNPEFNTTAAALKVAKKYLPAIGQLPTDLRRELHTIWIHGGREPFGGGNNNILIHDLQGDDYIRDGILEETLMHEAGHTSLDPHYAAASGWLEAQKADPGFISHYAKDNPGREDLAESFVPYFAVRFRRDRIPEALLQTIEETIPHRIAYLDSLKLDMHPQVAGNLILKIEKASNELLVSWPSSVGKTYQLQFSGDLMSWENYQSSILATKLHTTASVNIEMSPAGFFRIIELD